jgi:nitrate reductase gamma subunit
MRLQQFFFGIYPYIALSVFFLGSLIRFDREQYTWKADSSQLLEREQLRLGSNLFHIGILALFAGHFVGLLTPHAVWLTIGVSDEAHQSLAIGVGALFGVLCMIGGVVLWRRRMYNPRVRATSRRMDIFILDWLLVTLGVGLSTIPVSAYHAFHGDVSTMVLLAEWAQSVVSFRADPGLLQGPFVLRAHGVPALPLHAPGTCLERALDLSVPALPDRPHQARPLPPLKVCEKKPSLRSRRFFHKL